MNSCHLSLLKKKLRLKLTVTQQIEKQNNEKYVIYSQCILTTLLGKMSNEQKRRKKSQVFENIIFIFLKIVGSFI